MEKNEKDFFREDGNEEKKEQKEPGKILKGLINHCKIIEEVSEDLMIILKKAEEDNVHIEDDSSIYKTLERFCYPGDYEKMLVQMRGELNDLTADLYKKGVLITYEEHEEAKAKERAEREDVERDIESSDDYAPESSDNFEVGPKNADKVMNWVRIARDKRQGKESFPDTSPEGRPFLDAAELDIFGYDRVVVREGRIVELQSSKREKPTLSLGMEVTLKGDSEGYIPSGHRDGDNVLIKDFAEPFRNNSSDRIVKVSGNALEGWVKPSNIKVSE